MEKTKNKILYLIAGLMFAFVAILGISMISGCSNSNAISQEEAQVNGISIYNNFKTQYYLNEKLDVLGGVLNYTSDGRTVQVVITENMVTGFNSQTLGTRPLVITYQNFTTTVNYTVKAYPNLFTIGAVYKSSTKVGQKGQEQYFRVKILQDENILPFVLGDGDSLNLDDCNAQAWTELETSGFSLQLTKEFKNDSWTAVATGIFNEGTPGSSVITMNISNITEASFYVEMSVQSSGEYLYKFYMQKI